MKFSNLVENFSVIWHNQINFVFGGGYMKLIIFDAYGTLISTGTGSLDVVKEILALQEKDIAPEEFYRNWKIIFNRYASVTFCRFESSLY